MGADVSFLDNKYNLNVTYYNRHTKDKLAYINPASHSGFSEYLTNNGEIQNKGLEVEINARLIDNKGLKWNLGFNIAYNKNKIISLPNNGLIRNNQGAFEVYTGRK